MQSKKISAPLAGAISLAFALAGCATPDQGQHSQHQHQGGAASSTNTTNPASGMGMMDKQSMCDMHRKMKGDQPASGASRAGSDKPSGTSETARPPADMMDQRCQ